jgi:hypothetical protein
MLALAGLCFAGAPAAAAGPPTRVTIAVLPPGTTVERIAAADPRIAPGLIGAGLGPVPAQQTYVDVGQGARAFDSVYGTTIPRAVVRGGRVQPAVWEEIVERADGVPASLVPGLLASVLEREGVAVSAASGADLAALIAVDRFGRIPGARGCRARPCPALRVEKLRPAELGETVGGLRGDDMLIVIEAAPPERSLLAAGIAGRGYEGILTSPTTRLDGYAASTDVAPTVLERFGIEPPGEMTGRPIETRPAPERGAVAAVRELEDRLAVIRERRDPVVIFNALVWLALAALAALVRGPAGGRISFALFAIAMAWAPLLLLLSGGLRPSQAEEVLFVGLGAPLLAIGSMLLLRVRLPGPRAAYGAFALAAAASVAAVGVDMLFGSPLTQLSILGPKPDLGARFFGIGNELEATVGALLALGSGAAVTAARPADPRRAVSITVVVATLLALAVFAPGRFGADVGAAITYPPAAAAVVIAAYGATPLRIGLLLAAPLVGLAALVAVDLLSGGDAHLTRSVLEADGGEAVGEVLERRLTQSWNSIVKNLHQPMLIAALLGLVLVVWRRRELAGWLRPYPAAAAGFVGALTALAIGTVSNDSSSMILIISMVFVGAFSALAWAAARPSPRASAPAPSDRRR